MINNVDNVLDSAFCKRTSQDDRLHRWKSWDANTPFAPTFDVPIWIDEIKDRVAIDLIDAIKENDLGMYKKLWEDYNIFKWEYHSIKSLQASIARVYNDYMSCLEIEKENLNSLWIRGWAVALDPGQEVPRHCHAYHENTYLSGNISLSDTGTVTEYLIPHLSSYYGSWKAENKPGRITMFPSWIEHFVAPVEEKRYSIGFDIFDFNTIEYISKNKIPGDKAQQTILHSIPLA
jgi:hypothetical protein